MSKARSGSSFVREGRQRLGSSSSGTTSIPIDPNFRAKNRRTVEQWDKDDGNYADYTRVDSTDKDWLAEIGSWAGGKFDPSRGGPKAHAKFSEDMLTAIYNYSYGSGRFNIPLRDGVPFEGSDGPNELEWFIPRYLLREPADYRYQILDGIKVPITSNEAKKLEKALSRAYTYETDRGIIVARGGSASSGLPKVGDLTVTRGYTSTAYDGQDWGLTQPTRVRYIIRIPNGSRILHISGQYRDKVPMDPWNSIEAEILLRKNSVFRTTAVKEQPNGQIYIYQDFLGYGSKDKLKNRQLKGTPDHSIYKKIRMD
jgi:hypothetical protein